MATATNWRYIHVRHTRGYLQRPITSISCFTNWLQTKAIIRIEALDVSDNPSNHPMFYLEIEDLNISDLIKLRNQIDIAIKELSKTN